MFKMILDVMAVIYIAIFFDLDPEVRQVVNRALAGWFLIALVAVSIPIIIIYQIINQ